MKFYGHEPPWVKETHYGRWRRGAELWEGGWLWELSPPRNSVALLGEVLRDYYLKPMAEYLSKGPSFLTAYMEEARANQLSKHSA